MVRPVKRSATPFSPGAAPEWTLCQLNRINWVSRWPPESLQDCPGREFYHYGVQLWPVRSPVELVEQKYHHLYQTRNTLHRTNCQRQPCQSTILVGRDNRRRYLGYHGGPTIVQTPCVAIEAIIK